MITVVFGTTKVKVAHFPNNQVEDVIKRARRKHRGIPPLRQITQQKVNSTTSSRFAAVKDGDTIEVFTQKPHYRRRF